MSIEGALGGLPTLGQPCVHCPDEILSERHLEVFRRFKIRFYKTSVFVLENFFSQHHNQISRLGQRPERRRPHPLATSLHSAATSFAAEEGAEAGRRISSLGRRMPDLVMEGGGGGVPGVE
jgi:hypothetical protein